MFDNVTRVKMFSLYLHGKAEYGVVGEVVITIEIFHFLFNDRINKCVKMK